MSFSPRYPWEREPPSNGTPECAEASAPPMMPPAPKPRGRRPVARHAAASAMAGPPHWLYHHLTVSGPAETLAEFSRAARGAGVIPWWLDADRLEEDVFHLAATQPLDRRRLSVAGCHILARQFRSLVEAHYARMVAQVGRSQCCPFDLQMLLPVPGNVLTLGPTHPTALAWLSENWGTTDRLRQVVARPAATAGRRLPRGHAVVGYGFFTAGETPRAAIFTLAARWRALRFALRPRPAD